MFVTVKKCGGQGECIKSCPTEAIRYIDNRSFSCICCGACFDACPNHAIFKNKYGGYVVDRAKCNGCGICESVCPVDSIHIEDGLVKGICSRCGLCEEACPDQARIDAFDVVEDKQQKIINNLKAVTAMIGTGAGAAKIQAMDIPSKQEKTASRICINTNQEECVHCGRCSYYCPTGAIKVEVEEEGYCTGCHICNDVCPSEAIDKGVVDESKCSLCLNCVNTCPHEALFVEDFKVMVNTKDEEIAGTIVSCLNCGLCSEILDNGSIKRERTSLRYDPSKDEDTIENKEKRLLAIESCPVSILRETEDAKIAGMCVSCGRCIKACDEQKARNFETISWNGESSDDCISCGICVEFCPEEAISLKRGSIHVDLDKCIMCETCAVRCPKDAIPKSSIVKRNVIGGFNFIDQNLCVKCGMCERICPEDAIQTVAIPDDEKTLGTYHKGVKFVVNEEECTYCGACKNVCPSKAFIFERKFD